MVSGFMWDWWRSAAPPFVVNSRPAVEIGSSLAPSLRTISKRVGIITPIGAIKSISITSGIGVPLCQAQRGSMLGVL